MDSKTLEALKGSIMTNDQINRTIHEAMGKCFKEFTPSYTSNWPDY